MRVLSSGPPGIFTETCNLSRHIQHSRQAGISTGPTRDPLSQSWWPHPVCNPGGRHRKNLPHVVPLSPPLSPRLTGRWEWGACKPCAILHPLGACMMCASAYGTPEPCLPLGSSQAGAVLVNSVAVLKGPKGKRSLKCLGRTISFLLLYIKVLLTIITRFLHFKY